MKMKSCLLAFCASFLTVYSSQGQAPSNDNFTNAAVLFGNAVAFTGDLTGSTGEPIEVWGAPVISPYAYVQHSVWWSWTASESGPVTLVAMSYSMDTWTAEYGGSDTYVAVYSITNTNPTYTYSNASPPAVNAMWLDGAIDKLSLSFTATAGTTYQIQLADFTFGGSALKVNFQLFATNAPVILEQPADQTISPGGSAFFSVLAEGIAPFSYQWYSNGTAIPGATLAMLALDNVATNQAGAYSVIISNATGVVSSQTANLNVKLSSTNPQLSLIAVTTNGFAFSLTGDAGTYWRIESSTDLVNWHLENSFPSTSTFLLSSNAPTTYGNVAFNTNSSISLIVPANGSAKFLRARGYAAPNEICNNNLKKVRFAKTLWIRTTRRDPISGTSFGRFTIPATVDLEPYGINLDEMACPIAGTYNYFGNRYVNPPTCHAPGHVLEEPR